MIDQPAAEIDQPESKVESKIATYEQIHAMDKVELHIHLGGAYPSSYLEEVGTEEEVRDYRAFLGKIKKGLSYSEVFEVFGLISRIVNTDERVRLGAKALCQYFAADNTRYAEVRTGLKTLDCTRESYLKAALEGLREGDRLYGTTTPLMLSMRRETSREVALETVELAVKYKDMGICGIDISGDSTKGDSKQLLEAIHLAKENGLPIALHLGESTDECNHGQVWELNHFMPDRIGHCVHACQAALALIKDRVIPVEVCLRSAELAAMVDDASSHPGLELYRSGHPVTISTDDPTVFGQTLSEELHRWARIVGASIDDVAQLQENARKMRFKS